MLCSSECNNNTLSLGSLVSGFINETTQMARAVEVALERAACARHAHSIAEVLWAAAPFLAEAFCWFVEDILASCTTTCIKTLTPALLGTRSTIDHITLLAQVCAVDCALGAFAFAWLFVTACYFGAVSGHLGPNVIAIIDVFDTFASQCLAVLHSCSAWLVTLGLINALIGVHCVTLLAYRAITLAGIFRTAVCSWEVADAATTRRMLADRST